MKLIKRGDLIVDKYGNYYYATETYPNRVRLVNAFMDLSFRRTLNEVYYEEYQGELIGERPMFLLKGHIDMIVNNKSTFKIYALEEIEAHFDVFIDTLIDPEAYRK